MKVYIDTNLDAKVLKAATKVLEDNGVIVEPIDAKAVMAEIGELDFALVGNAEFLESFRRVTVSPEAKVRLVHLADKGERLNTNGFAYEFTAQRCVPKKREVSQTLSNFGKTFKALNVQLPNGSPLPEQTHRSLTDFAKSKGLELNVQRYVDKYANWRDVEDLEHVQIDTQGNYTFRHRRITPTLVELIITNMIKHAAGHRNVYECA